MRLLFGVLLLSGLALGQPNPNAVVPDGIPPCAGVVQWAPSRYLVTHDFKSGEAGSRFGLISTNQRLSYQSLQVDWSKVGGEANDLESLAPIEGKAGHFLACESGYVKGQFGHLYWLSAQPDTVAVEARYAMPAGLTQEIEGLATLHLEGNRWMVLLGGRGGRSEEPGRLYWGILDRDKNEIEWPKEGLQGAEIHLPRRLGPFARTLSDMFLDEKHRLFVSSCSTPGRLGPNRSLIFLAGTVRDNLKTPFHRATENQDVWWVDGCKIEGICPCDRPGYGPAYVTDDDELGGLWRSVPASPSISY
ncbi:MAG: hypothetical protein J0I12_28155 [Candidatus Eremiobacteraeota bacterium]|nr:hypothetical protein [Candidatus Eremiobacteraeota bacterium]